MRSRRLFSIDQAANFLPQAKYFRDSTFNDGVRRLSKNKELVHKRILKRSVTSKIPENKDGSIEWLLKSRKQNGKRQRRFDDNHREKRGQTTNGKVSEIYINMYTLNKFSRLKNQKIKIEILIFVKSLLNFKRILNRRQSSTVISSLTVLGFTLLESAIILSDLGMHYSYSERMTSLLQLFHVQ